MKTFFSLPKHILVFLLILSSLSVYGEDEAIDGESPIYQRSVSLRWACTRPDDQQLISAASEYYMALMQGDWPSVERLLSPHLESKSIEVVKFVLILKARPEVRFIEVLTWRPVQFESSEGVLLISRSVSIREGKRFNGYMWNIFYKDKDGLPRVAPFGLSDPISTISSKPQT